MHLTRVRTTLWTMAALAAGLAAAGPALAQIEISRPIEDNSFLIEEAYNQEAGVVQHISTFSHPEEGDDWEASFTQEWPLFSQRHQLSYTIPVSRVAGGTGVGDVALNYRYQVSNGAVTPVAFAPRLSVLLPTGSEAEGRGAGGAGVQVNLPVSIAATYQWVLHSNVGATYTPTARNSLGDEAATTGFNLGQSAIWLATPNFNLMLEALWTRNQVVVGNDATAHGTSFFISPGVRGAINLRSGLQIVPGIAVPVGVGPSSGETSIFLYLSLEHPFSDAGR
jgi:hypothetical protein